MVDDRLAISAVHADGRITRWGPDELDATRTPGGLSFTTTIPGGFKDCTVTLPRRIDVDYDDEHLYDTLRVYGAGNRTAWEGYNAQFPRSHANEFQVTVGAVGWAAHLRHDPGFTEVFVDRDLGHWENISATRQATLIGLNFRLGDHSVTRDDTGYPTLAFRIDQDWPTSFEPLVEAMYDAGAGNTIAAIYYDYSLTHAGGAWNLYVASMSDDIATASASTGNLAGSASGAGTHQPVPRYRYGQIQWTNNSSPGGGGSFLARLRNTAVYGNHGLSTYGGAPQGVLASDVIAYIVRRSAPKLRVGYIQPTGFPIPHLEFRDPVTPEEAIQRTNAFQLYEWGVYDNREFFYRQPAPEYLTWEARLSEGAHLDLEGPQADDVYNGVIVSYQEPGGVKRSVGPPGASTDSTSVLLADITPENPVNQHGIPRRWAKLDISHVTTLQGATQLGQVWLAEHAINARRGSIVLSGTAHHPTEGPVPAWRVRAGDWLRVSDHPADLPRRIIETRYSHDTRTLSASLDSQVHKLDAILERIGVSLVGVAS